MNLIDSSCWLDFFADTGTADAVAPLIERTGELVVPTVCLYEVFKKLLAAVGEDAAIMAIAHMRLGQVVDLDGDLAVFDAKLSRDHHLPFAASVIYAVAQKHGCTLHTKDKHFEGLQGVKYYGSEGA